MNEINENERKKQNENTLPKFIAVDQAIGVVDTVDEMENSTADDQITNNSESSRTAMERQRTSA